MDTALGDRREPVSVQTLWSILHVILTRKRSLDNYLRTSTFTSEAILSCAHRDAESLTL